MLLGADYSPLRKEGCLRCALLGYMWRLSASGCRELRQVTSAHYIQLFFDVVILSVLPRQPFFLRRLSAFGFRSRIGYLSMSAIIEGFGNRLDVAITFLIFVFIVTKLRAVSYN